MDWERAIENNRAALRRILTALAAMAGLALAAPAGAPSPPAGSQSLRTLPRHLHRAVLRLLRPAEAAARRLIVVAACGFAAPAPGERPAKASARKPASSRLRGHAAGASLPLFDALPRWRRRRPRPSGVPRISLPGSRAPFPVPPPPTPFDPVDAARLTLRLCALANALDDLPAQARRFARWRAARAAFVVRERQGARDRAPRALRRVVPLRPGRPPGWRAPGSCLRPAHEVHAVLAVVHDLALWAMERPDTS